MDLDSIKKEVQSLKAIGSINTVRVSLIINQLIEEVEQLRTLNSGLEGQVEALDELLEKRK